VWTNKFIKLSTSPFFELFSTRSRPIIYAKISPTHQSLSRNSTQLVSITVITVLTAVRRCGHPDG